MNYKYKKRIRPVLLLKCNFSSEFNMATYTKCQRKYVPPHYDVWEVAGHVSHYNFGIFLSKFIFEISLANINCETFSLIAQIRAESFILCFKTRSL